MPKPGTSANVGKRSRYPWRGSVASSFVHSGRAGVGRLDSVTGPPPCTCAANRRAPSRALPLGLDLSGEAQQPSHTARGQSPPKHTCSPTPARPPDLLTTATRVVAARGGVGLRLVAANVHNGRTAARRKRRATPRRRQRVQLQCGRAPLFLQLDVHGPRDGHGDGMDPCAPGPVSQRRASRRSYAGSCSCPRPGVRAPLPGRLNPTRCD